MKNENVPQRKPVRLPGYDYSQNGAYFVTICTKDRKCVLSEITAAPTLSWIINQFKGIVAKRIGHSIWQRSYYEHVIRDEDDYLKKWQYIDDNPAKWADDEYYT